MYKQTLNEMRADCISFLTQVVTPERPKLKLWPEGKPYNQYVNTFPRVPYCNDTGYYYDYMITRLEQVGTMVYAVGRNVDEEGEPLVYYMLENLTTDALGAITDIVVNLLTPNAEQTAEEALAEQWAGEQLAAADMGMVLHELVFGEIPPEEPTPELPW